MLFSPNCYLLSMDKVSLGSQRENWRQWPSPRRPAIISLYRYHLPRLTWSILTLRESTASHLLWEQNSKVFLISIWKNIFLNFFFKVKTAPRYFSWFNFAVQFTILCLLAATACFSTIKTKKFKISTKTYRIQTCCVAFFFHIILLLSLKTLFFFHFFLWLSIHIFFLS